MKTICFFNSIQTWGGGEKWHFEMATHLASLEFKVFFYTSKDSVLDAKLAGFENIERLYVDVSNLSYWNRSKINKVAQEFEKNAIETVIINSSQDMKMAGLAAKKAGVQHIVYRRGSAIPIKNSIVNRYFFKSVITDILANSHATKKTIVAKNKNLFPLDKITVIPNGIETEKFLNEVENVSAAKKTVFTLGNLGRLVKQKNQLFLLEVAKKLKEENIAFKLKIGGDGKLKPILEEKTIAYNLESEVEFVGFVESPKEFMRSLDVFLLSSLWEGFGYVIAEAMLCEKPVIAFDASSNPELVEHGKNGFLTPVNDVGAFVTQIKKIEEDRNLISELGIYGKSKIVNEFDASIAREKVKNYIENL